MLLANMTAATHLYKNLPNHALLRRHDPPQMNMLLESQAMLEKIGIHIDVESAGALEASLIRYRPDPSTTSDDDLYLASCRSKVLNALCSKPMMVGIFRSYNYREIFTHFFVLLTACQVFLHLC